MFVMGDCLAKYVLFWGGVMLAASYGLGIATGIFIAWVF